MYLNETFKECTPCEKECLKCNEKECLKCEEIYLLDSDSGKCIQLKK